MRRRYLGLAFLAAVVASAAPAPAPAADHQYFVISSNETIAAVVDLSARSRAGDIVSLDLSLLRRQPVKIGGLDAHWADGVQEFDCAGHRSRTMLIAGLTLDRSQKANQPGAAFQPWTLNAPGSPIRAAEDFICRNIAGGDIRPVADLGAFQRSYFRAGAPAPPVAAATPPAARPAAKAGSDMDLLLIEETPAIGTIVNRASRTRLGDVARIDTIALTRAPVSRGGYQLNWTEGLSEVDCRAHRWRSKVTMMHTLEMDHQEKTPSPQFSEWRAIDASTAGFEGFMCQGTMGKGYRTVGDLQSYRRAFMARAPQAAAPSPAGPRPPLAKGDYLMGLVGQSGASLIKKSSIKRAADVVSYSELAILPGPARFGDKIVYWVESTWQVDCKAHRARQKVDSYLSEDRSVRSPELKSVFEPWEPNKPNSFASQSEEFLCQGKHPDEFKPVDDVDDFQKDFVKAVKAGVFKD
jgi:hypothetical protein